MHARLAEVGLAGGIGGDFVANSLELAAANVFKILPLRRGRGGFVEIDRNLEARAISAPTWRAMATQSSMRDAVDGDEGNDIGRAHARVRALVLGQVDQLGSLAYAANRGFLNGFPFAGQRDDAAVVIGIHLPVEKINAGNLHGFDNGIDFGCIAAFRKIGNAFNESVGHGKKDSESRARSYN